MVTEDRIEKHIRNGYGQGSLKNYKPWIKVNHFSSIGRSHRVLGLKTERVHHLLSDLELKMLNILDFSDKVIDIREQYPLLDMGSPTIETTKAIALALGIKHPQYRGKNVVITTDFLITAGSDKKIIARTVKPNINLHERTLEKFEVERNYWLRLGVEWAVVTDKELSNPTITNNLTDLKSAYTYVVQEKIASSFLIKVYDLFADMHFKYLHTSLTSCSLDMDRILIIDEGTSLKIIKYLMAIKAISFDESTSLQKKATLNELSLKFRKDALLHKSNLVV